MSITITSGLPANIVEIGNEVTQGIIDGLNGASPAPSSSNPFFTIAGGTLTGQTTVENANFDITNGTFTLSNAAAPFFYFTLGDGGQYFDDVAKDEFLFSPTEIQVRNQTTGLGTKLNLTGIEFPDSTIQTTAANIPAMATLAQSEALLSETTVINPADLRTALLNASFYKPLFSTFTSSTLGTGGLNDTLWDMRRLQGPTSASNTYVRTEHSARFSRGRSFNENINWTKPQAVYFRMVISNVGVDANSTFIGSFGEVSSTNIGDATTRSIGVKYSTGSGLTLFAHDGTTLTVPAGSFTPIANQAFDVLMTSDGLGTINYYVNNTLIGTTTLGPKTLLAGFISQNNLNFRVYNTSTPSGSQLSIYMSGFTIHNGN
jgi:hypothetical protein